MIGATLGAFSAFLMNIILEFVKPLVARRLAKGRMKKDMTKEFVVNFKNVVNAGSRN